MEAVTWFSLTLVQHFFFHAQLRMKQMTEESSGFNWSHDSILVQECLCLIEDWMSWNKNFKNPERCGEKAPLKSKTIGNDKFWSLFPTKYSHHKVFILTFYAEEFFKNVSCNFSFLQSYVFFFGWCLLWSNF